MESITTKAALAAEVLAASPNNKHTKKALQAQELVLSHDTGSLATLLGCNRPSDVAVDIKFGTSIIGVLANLHQRRADGKCIVDLAATEHTKIAAIKGFGPDGKPLLEGKPEPLENQPTCRVLATLDTGVQLAPHDWVFVEVVSSLPFPVKIKDKLSIGSKALQNAITRVIAVMATPLQTANWLAPTSMQLVAGRAAILRNVSMRATQVGTASSGGQFVVVTLGEVADQVRAASAAWTGFEGAVDLTNAKIGSEGVCASALLLISSGNVNGEQKLYPHLHGDGRPLFGDAVSRRLL